MPSTPADSQADQQPSGQATTSQDPGRLDYYQLLRQYSTVYHRAEALKAQKREMNGEFEDFVSELSGFQGFSAGKDLQSLSIDELIAGLRDTRLRNGEEAEEGEQRSQETARAAELEQGLR